MKKPLEKKNLTFSEELEAFASYTDQIHYIRVSEDSFLYWKQSQFAIIDDVHQFIGKLSIKYRDIYDEDGPFSLIIENFNKIKPELTSIINSETNYGYYISEQNAFLVRKFINRISLFISESLIIINKSRSISKEKKRLILLINFLTKKAFCSEI